jgi:hypothetical protein
VRQHAAREVHLELVDAVDQVGVGEDREQRVLVAALRAERVRDAGQHGDRRVAAHQDLVDELDAVQARRHVGADLAAFGAHDPWEAIVVDRTDEAVQERRTRRVRLRVREVRLHVDDKLVLAAEHALRELDVFHHALGHAGEAALAAAACATAAGAGAAAAADDTAARAARAAAAAAAASACAAHAGRAAITAGAAAARAAAAAHPGRVFFAAGAAVDQVDHVERGGRAAGARQELAPVDALAARHFVGLLEHQLTDQLLALAVRPPPLAV